MKMALLTMAIIAAVTGAFAAKKKFDCYNQVQWYTDITWLLCTNRAIWSPLLVLRLYYGSLHFIFRQARVYL